MMIANIQRALELLISAQLNHVPLLGNLVISAIGQPVWFLFAAAALICIAQRAAAVRQEA